MKASTNKLKRQRIFRTIAPLGIAAVLTILFKMLGGGQGSGRPVTATTGKGINVSVPEAHIKEEKTVNKTSYYNQAQKDSLNQQEKQKRGEAVSKTGNPGGDSLPVVLRNTDPNEEKVKRQVANIRETLSQVIAEQSDRRGLRPAVSEKRETSLSSPDVDRLERMLRVIKDEGVGTNPEMQELNKVLDKLITVQHPDVNADTGLRKLEANVLRPLAVFPAQAEETVSGWKTVAGNRFYDLETSNGEEKPEATGIEAIIPETQTLVNGALLKLELATELVIKNINIPRGTPLYGVAHLNGERLQVMIASIRYHGQVYPVSLQVIDEDGLTGIYEPGSISRDVARESTGESINGIGAVSLDPSLGAQVATAGIQMARSLTSKKIRLVRVTVKKGYRVFLKDMSVM